MATLIPLGAYASSWYDPGLGTLGWPQTCLDGNAGTRWASNAGTPVWIAFDFCGDVSITDVSIVWEGAYATSFKLQTSTDGTTWTDVFTTTTGPGGTQNISSLTGHGRFLRMYATVLAVAPFCSIFQITFTGTVNVNWSLTPTGATANNSSQGATSLADDGVVTTRWGSNAGSPSWLRYDFGSTKTITGVALLWEAAEASGYNIQTSPDDTNWTTVGSGTGSSSMPPNALGGSARYVRIISTSLLFSPFMSLYEFTVLNEPAAGGQPATAQFFGAGSQG